MCGIFGYVAARFLNDEEILKSLDRRGPDGRGRVQFPWPSLSVRLHCVLLHTRLAIIDLDEAANQPMWDASKNYAIVYNGEIYNYRELRSELERLGHCFATQSDTEVLLYGYIEWHEAVLSKLRGMFAFGIYDSPGRKLFLARDHFGQKPLYYYQCAETFCFSSSISALLASEVKSRFTFSKDSVRDYLALGCFLHPDTILSEVKALLPGHYMIYRGEHTDIIKYYDLTSQVCESSDSREEMKHKLRTLMFDTVEKHLIADVPIGIFLSGGIDSSLIAGIASKVSKERIRTFSVGFKKGAFGQDETAVASKTARFLNTVHETILLDQQDYDQCIEHFIDAIDVPSIDGLNTLLISRAVSRRLKVVLSGLGGDEMFGGYPVFHQIHALQSLTWQNRFISRFPKKALSLIGRTHLQYVRSSLPDIVIRKRMVGALSEEQRVKLSRLVPSAVSPLRAVSIFEISNYMANMLLRDMDAVTMHHSLESRMPFVDQHMFAFVMSVSDDDKIRRGVNKSLLVDTFSDLLVEDVYRSPKRGFNLPISSWIRDSLNSGKARQLSEIAVSLNLPSTDCPFVVRKVRFDPKKTNTYYKWFILLKWIDKNRDKLALC